MSAHVLSTALDRVQNLQLGENQNLEYRWSNEQFDTLITQLYFQLTRPADIKQLAVKYEELLKIVFEKDCKVDEVKLLCKLIAHTRDITHGKGEYKFTYMMLSGLANFAKTSTCNQEIKKNINNALAFLIEKMVKSDDGVHPFGSWKDIKYLCNYHVPQEQRNKYYVNSANDIIINKCIFLINEQLKIDQTAKVKTLLAKWIPREKSDKFGWLTHLLAYDYFKSWIDSKSTATFEDNNDGARNSAARRKCLTHYRKLVAKINKELETTQINQCAGTWIEIDFDKKVTSITMRKQSKAFLNIQKNGKERQKTAHDYDRITCSENYREYIENCKSGKSIAKGKNVSIVDFVRDAINLLSNQGNRGPELAEKDALNMQWLDNSKKTSKLNNVIAMVDTSGSMEMENCNPLYSAIGLGIRIAEKSNFGKRIMTFSTNPEWLNLDDCNNFVEMVAKVRQAKWGLNTNFRAALDLILRTAIQNRISKEDMSNMVLIILTDMQIDYSDSININPRNCRGKVDNLPMFDMMKKKYEQVGYELPHIVFWNLRSTNGFPSVTSEKNASMMSGFSANLLDTFSEKGVDILKEMTPYKQLVAQLSKERYSCIDKIVDDLF